MPAMEQNDVIKHEPGSGVARGWHLDKRITVSHLFTTLAFAVGLGGTMYAIDTKVNQNTNGLKTHVEVEGVKRAALQIQIDQLKASEMASRLRAAARQTDIIRRLERIEDGVNRHIESTLKQHLESRS
jgi:hypothetical protein